MICLKNNSWVESTIVNSSFWRWDHSNQICSVANNIVALDHLVNSRTHRCVANSTQNTHEQDGEQIKPLVPRMRRQFHPAECRQSITKCARAKAAEDRQHRRKVWEEDCNQNCESHKAKGHSKVYFL